MYYDRRNSSLQSFSILEVPYTASNFRHYLAVNLLLLHIIPLDYKQHTVNLAGFRMMAIFNNVNSMCAAFSLWE